jgi:type IV pilus assembly protein PilV
MKALPTPLATRRRQTGAYLLEALIGILIFALGVLGIVGLQAASLRTTTDSALRAEAVFAANQLLGQMWTDDEANLTAKYDGSVPGTAYKDFAAQLKTVQGGAWAQDPTVTINGGTCNIKTVPSNTSSTVAIQIFWRSDTATDPCPAVPALHCHSYTTCGVVGQN